MIRVVRCIKAKIPLPVLSYLKRIHSCFRSKKDAIKKAFKVSLVQYRINKALRELKLKNDPVRVAFLVIYDMVFQFERVFRLMRTDPQFAPTIVVIPDVLRGRQNLVNSFESSYVALKRKYETVLRPCDADYNFWDITNDFDIFFVMNPYEAMTHEFYSFKYLAEHGKPVCYSNYGYGEGTINAKNFDRMPAFSYLWRFYLDKEDELPRMQKNQLILRLFNRLRLSGAAKIDQLGYIKQDSRCRKRIILAPHHSLVGNDTPLEMGNFNVYVDLIKKLPSLYPQIDWVFRPHPLLFWTMIKCGYWEVGDDIQFLNEMRHYENFHCQLEGGYYESFVNSDAIIQDCGSFLAEYLVTGHPECYVLRNRNKENVQFNSFGQKMLSHCYKAYSEQDIIDFIENVVIAGNDPMKEERMKFAKEKLMFNYPHASEAILADIKKALGRA